MRRLVRLVRYFCGFGRRECRFYELRRTTGIVADGFTDRQQRLSYSPFNQYFVIQAMARMGRYPEALTTIDDCWGGQLRYGGTTFFEVYRPSWNDALAPNGAPVNNQCGYTSFTHPWSAGVTKWLTEEILGVKPVLPGFGRFLIAPHLSERVTSVEGCVPTLHGTIRVVFDIKTGKGRITVPDGTVAAVGIPKTAASSGGSRSMGKRCRLPRVRTMISSITKG